MSVVIVQSLKDTPALTDNSILFRSDRLALAKVGGPAEALYLCAVGFHEVTF